MNQILAPQKNSCFDSWQTLQGCSPILSKAYQNAAYYSCKFASFNALLNPHLVNPRSELSVRDRVIGNMALKIFDNKLCHGYALWSLQNTVSSAVHLGQLLLGHGEHFASWYQLEGYEKLKPILAQQEVNQRIKNKLLFLHDLSKHILIPEPMQAINLGVTVAKLVGFSSRKFARFENSYSTENYMHIAAASGSIAMLRQLHDDGYPISLRDAAGNTALHIAARKGDVQIALFLLGQGIDGLALNNAGDHFIQTALNSGNGQFVDEILRSGYQVDRSAILNDATVSKDERLVLALKNPMTVVLDEQVIQVGNETDAVHSKAEL